MKYHTLLFRKLGNTSQNLLYAAVVTGALRVKLYLHFAAGDLCDTDIDGDGILNSNDTCVYLANPAQTDTDGDGIGDDCEDDADGDGIIDKNDTCPYNPSISKTSFKDYFTVDLYPGLNTTSPSWLIKANEGEVMQTESTGMPTMLIGRFTMFGPRPEKTCLLGF